MKLIQFEITFATQREAEALDVAAVSLQTTPQDVLLGEGGGRSNNKMNVTTRRVGEGERVGVKKTS